MAIGPGCGQVNGEKGPNTGYSVEVAQIEFLLHQGREESSTFLRVWGPRKRKGGAAVRCDEEAAQQFVGEGGRSPLDTVNLRSLRIQRGSGIPTSGISKVEPGFVGLELVPC